MDLLTLLPVNLSQVNVADSTCPSTVGNKSSPVWNLSCLYHSDLNKVPICVNLLNEQAFLVPFYNNSYTCIYKPN